MLRHVMRSSKTRNLKKRNYFRRRGYVMIKFALLLLILLGMAGLVIDAGFLMAQHRQVHNAVDAAALAAAMARLRGSAEGDAVTTATIYFKQYNGLFSAPDPIVNIPPASGAYAGDSNFVEVIGTLQVSTFLIHVLPGVDAQHNVQARAVAGYEPHAAGEGVITLNPNARPGLDVSGGGTLRVNGRIVDNSEGGGVDENNEPINNGNNGFAARAGQPNSDTGIYATIVDVVGGVDRPDQFKPYDPGDSSPLKTRQPPEPDPLINLPTPTMNNGVDPTLRGSVSVTNTNVNGLSTDQGGLNFQAVGGEEVAGGLHTAAAGEVILHPGVYDSLDVQGGLVYLVPGIYVTRHKPSGGGNALKITGGTITADGVMFYNTGHNFKASDGTPDINDGSKAPPGNNQPPEDGANFGDISITASMTLSPIDTSEFKYPLHLNGPAVSDKFDGMLFYQRRRDGKGVDITGDAAEGGLTGTLYAKWAHFKIAGQGTYDAQFVVGSLDIAGQGNVTLLGGGQARGKANQVYLVE